MNLTEQNRLRKLAGMTAVEEAKEEPIDTGDKAANTKTTLNSQSQPDQKSR